MNQIEWFYARGEQQHGPISSAELKRIATTGELKPDDLVWREGLSEWTFARNVRGLFEDVVPLGIAPGAIPSGSSGVNLGAPPVVGPAASPVAPATGFQQPAAPPYGATAQPGYQASQPGYQTQQPVYPTAQPAAGSPLQAVLADYAAHDRKELVQSVATGHLFDLLLDGLRKQFSDRTVAELGKKLALVGQYALFGAMAALVAVGVAVAAKGDGFGAAMPMWIGIVVVAILHYVAVKMNRVIEPLHLETPEKVSSTAVLDCLGLIFVVGGIGGFIEGIVLAVGGFYVGIVFGLGGLVVGLYGALIALQPASIRVSTEPGLPLPEKGIGLIGFLLKAQLRAASAIFAVGVICAAVALIHSCVHIMQAEKEMVPMAQLEADVYMSMLFYAAAWPLMSYLVFLLGNIILGLWRAILSIPHLGEKK